MNDSRIPGVTLAIVDNGEVVHARGFGDDGRGNSVTADTPHGTQREMNATGDAALALHRGPSVTAR